MPAWPALHRAPLIELAQFFSSAMVAAATTFRCCLGRCNAHSTSAVGRVSRVSPVHTAMRNCTRDEGGPFEVGSQVLSSSHRKLLSSKAMVVSVAETLGLDFGRQD
jgi:methylphosphotriester-DNA--protein-cysteine methyltransferase